MPVTSEASVLTTLWPIGHQLPSVRQLPPSSRTTRGRGVGSRWRAPEASSLSSGSAGTELHAASLRRGARPPSPSRTQLRAPSRSREPTPRPRHPGRCPHPGLIPIAPPPAPGGDKAPPLHVTGSEEVPEEVPVTSEGGRGAGYFGGSGRSIPPFTVSRCDGGRARTVVDAIPDPIPTAEVPVTSEASVLNTLRPIGHQLPSSGSFHLHPEHTRGRGVGSRWRAPEASLLSIQSAGTEPHAASLRRGARPPSPSRTQLRAPSRSREPTPRPRHPGRFSHPGLIPIAPPPPREETKLLPYT